MSQRFLRTALHSVTQSPLQCKQRRNWQKCGESLCGIRGSLRGAHEDSSFMGRNTVPHVQGSPRNCSTPNMEAQCSFVLFIYIYLPLEIINKTMQNYITQNLSEHVIITKHRRK